MSENGKIINFFEKRGLTVQEASSYCGVSVSGFRHWVSTGKVSCKIPGTNRYDRKSLDAAIDNLMGLATANRDIREDDTPEAAFDRCFVK